MGGRAELAGGGLHAANGALTVHRPARMTRSSQMGGRGAPAHPENSSVESVARRHPKVSHLALIFSVNQKHTSTNKLSKCSIKNYRDEFHLTLRYMDIFFSSI